jgi:hypothetical protein
VRRWPRGSAGVIKAATGCLRILARAAERRVVQGQIIVQRPAIFKSVSGSLCARHTSRSFDRRDIRAVTISMPTTAIQVLGHGVLLVIGARQFHSIRQTLVSEADV